MVQISKSDFLLPMAKINKKELAKMIKDLYAKVGVTF